MNKYFLPYIMKYLHTATIQYELEVDHVCSGVRADALFGDHPPKGQTDRHD